MVRIKVKVTVCLLPYQSDTDERGRYNNLHQAKVWVVCLLVCT